MPGRGGLDGHCSGLALDGALLPGHGELDRAICTIKILQWQDIAVAAPRQPLDLDFGSHCARHVLARRSVSRGAIV